MSRPTDDEVEVLVKEFQFSRKLKIDGILGPITRKQLTQSLFAPDDKKDIFRHAKLLSGTFTYGHPKITSGYKTVNPDRPNHEGVDIFFRYVPGMGGAVVKDGEAAGSKGVPKWFIPKGTKALAAASGKVHSVKLLKTGMCIWLDHGGDIFSGYMHLTSADVHTGQQVLVGADLGDVGDNPVDNDARHLHFQISVGAPGKNVDPAPLLPKEFSL